MSPSSIWKFADNNDINGYTLLIPSVAVGNVGQLACDLLISSLDMQRIGSVYSPALIPVLGHDPYDLNSNSLSSSCEVYKCAPRKLAVMQLRAPLVYKYARAFLEELVSKVQEKHLKDIFIVTSSFAHEKKHILSSPYRYVANETCSYKEKVAALGWSEHELLEGSLKIYGGGFAALLYDICKENKMPCLILFKYCSEGDNIPDAYDMIKYLSGLLPLFKEPMELSSQLVQPVSWKLLYGRPPPWDIY